MGPVSVNAHIGEVVEMARSRWKDEPEARGVTVEVVTELGETADIQGDPSELDDAILNLLLNAVDAMPEGGTITLSTRTVEAGVQLTVSDTGIGMAEETRRRVFEPFFTTKADVGSGLGLPTVLAAVTRWGGRIEVDSTPGEGTTFTLHMPVWAGPASSAETPTAADPSVRSGKLVIVEDDEEVCALLERLLSENHWVEVVRDGREAVEQFASGAYDVALIDLGMPGMAGDQVAAQMVDADPGLVTILITGWPMADEDPRRSVFDFRVDKPFDDLDALKSVVRQAVELHDSRGDAQQR